jgi:hypothetical protein
VGQSFLGALLIARAGKFDEGALALQGRNDLSPSFDSFFHNPIHFVATSQPLGQSNGVWGLTMGVNSDVIQLCLPSFSAQREECGLSNLAISIKYWEAFPNLNPPDS